MLIIRMTMRTIPPLDDDAWDEFMKGLEEGPSPEMIKFIKESEEMFKDFKVPE